MSYQRGDYNDRPSNDRGYGDRGYDSGRGYDNGPTPRGGRGYDDPPPRNNDQRQYRDDRGRPPPEDDRRYGGPPQQRGGQGGGHYQQRGGYEDDYNYNRGPPPPRDDYRGGAPHQSARGGGGGGAPPRPKPRSNVDEVIGKIKEKVVSRGGGGISGFGRMFRMYDRDRNHLVSREELENGLTMYGISLSKDEVEALFHEFDRDNGGTIQFDELLRAVRPPMSKNRVDLINKAYDKMDVTGDGVLTVEDIAKSYNVDHHPKYKSGEWTKKQCFKQFLDKFQADSPQKDEKVTREEFQDYYFGVSMSIDKDVYFDYMMRQTWKLT